MSVRAPTTPDDCNRASGAFELGKRAPIAGIGLGENKRRDIMKHRNVLATILVLGLSLHASAGSSTGRNTSALGVFDPGTPDLNNWKSPCYNCYNYATGLKTAFFAQPGGGVQDNVN